MPWRSTYLVSAALTAFTLVLVGAVAATVTRPTTPVEGPPPPAPAQTGLGAPAAGWSTTAAGPPAPETPQATPYPVSADAAAATARRAAGGPAPARPPELVSFQGTVAYEVQLDRGVVYVDATSGQVLSTAVRASQPVVASSRDGKHRDGKRENREHSDGD